MKTLRFGITFSAAVAASAGALLVLAQVAGCGGTEATGGTVDRFFNLLFLEQVEQAFLLAVQRVATLKQAFCFATLDS